jgi:hypothetical protein
MVIGVVSWALHIAGAQSLKDKRGVIKSMKARMHNEFNVSVAETAHHDTWQTAELTACVVAVDRVHAEKVLRQVDRFVESNPLCRITDSQTSFFDAWLTPAAPTGSPKPSVRRSRRSSPMARRTRASSAW